MWNSMSKKECGETEEGPAEGYQMVKSLELMSHKERLREMVMFNLARSRLICYLTAADKVLERQSQTLFNSD